MPKTKVDLRILVCEDNLMNQKVVGLMLENLGYSCDLVDNGQKALDALASKHYDLVFMDCQMPVMDGYETVRRIRSSARTRHNLVVAMTAHALQGDREKCLAAGMDDYICKPISLEILDTTLKKWTNPINGLKG
jgi:CheY-like chemotaxis protein